MADMKPQKYKDDRPAEYFDQFHAAARRGRRLDLSVGSGDRLAACAHPLAHPRDRRQQRAEEGAADPGAQPLQPDGPLLHRPLPAPQGPLHGQIADLRPAGPHLRLQARRRLPGPPRSPRRGGVQDRLQRSSTRKRCCSIYAEGGRSRSGELGEPKAGIGRLALESGAPVVPVAIHGSAGVRRWKRFRFPGSPSSSASRSAFRSRPSPIASASSRWRARSSTACGRCTPVWPGGKLHVNSTTPEKNAFGSSNLPRNVGGREQG